MKRRDFIKTGSIGAAGLAASQLTGCRTMPTREGEIENGRLPNLLFVFSDQHSHDMLGCYGNEQIITPNLDRFAGEGVQFSMCISNYPLCTPYRSMLLSGQNPLYNGALFNDVQMLPDNGRCFGEVLGDAGYRTGYIGKWHLMGGDRKRPIPPGPLRYGFDEVFYTNNCTVDFRPGICFYYDEEGQKVHFDEWEVYGQTRQAIEFLDDCDEDRPWALFVSWHPPHDCWSGEPDGSRYKTLPELMALYDKNKIRIRRNAAEVIERTREDYQGHMAMVTGCDIAFGRLMDKVGEKGMLENTVVVFTADHGDLLPATPTKKMQVMGSNHRPWPKLFPEDASIRVPLLIRWPRGLRPRRSDLLVGTLDLMPTILGLMGLPVPDTCQGKDLSTAIVEGNDDAVESVPLFAHYSAMGWRGVVTRDYTYSIDYMEQFPDAEVHQEDRNWKPHARWNVLYNRSEDPWQLRNLFTWSGHKSLREDLHALTWEWLKYFDDSFPYGRSLLQTCTVKNEPDWTSKGRPIDCLAGFSKA